MEGRKRQKQKEKREKRDNERNSKRERQKKKKRFMCVVFSGDQLEKSNLQLLSAPKLLATHKMTIN